MGRVKGNSGPKSRTMSPVHATKNGLKANESANTTTPQTQSPSSKKQHHHHHQGMQNGSLTSTTTTTTTITTTSAAAKHKSSAKVLSQQAADKKKLKTRVRNGLLSSKADVNKDDEEKEIATKPMPKVLPSSVVPVRVNVAKKSTTSASAKIAQKLASAKIAQKLASAKIAHKLAKKNTSSDGNDTVNGKTKDKAEDNDNDDDDVMDTIVAISEEDSDSAAVPPVAVTKVSAAEARPSKVKIDVDFEDDSDESENEGLKQLMQNIDKTLVCPSATAPSARASSDGDKPAASKEKFWMESETKVETVDEVECGSRKRSCTVAAKPPVAASPVAIKSRRRKKNKKRKAWNLGMKMKKVDEICDTKVACDGVAPTSKVTSTVEEIEEAIEAVVVVKADNVKTEDDDGDDDGGDDNNNDDDDATEDKDDADSDVDKSFEGEADDQCDDEKTESFESASSRLGSVSPTEPSPKVALESSIRESTEVAIKEDTDADADITIDLEQKSQDEVAEDENKEQASTQDSVQLLTSSEEDEDKAETSVTKRRPKGEVNEDKDKDEPIEEGDSSKDTKKVVDDAKEIITETDVNVDVDCEKTPVPHSSECVNDADVSVSVSVCSTAKTEEHSVEEIADDDKEVVKQDENDVKDDKDQTKKEDKEVADVEEVEDKATDNGNGNDEASSSLVKRKRTVSDDDGQEQSAVTDKKLKADDTSQQQVTSEVPKSDATSASSAPQRTMLRRVFGVSRTSAAMAPPTANEPAAAAAAATIIGDDGQEMMVGTTVTLSEDGQTCDSDAASASATSTSTATTTQKKKKKRMYRMNKSELEMLVMSKLTEYFTDGNKSEISALRRRCERFEKALEAARRKAQQCQKELTDMHIVLQRAQTSKPLPGQLFKFNKPSMRSVGLQVQLTRYVPVHTSDACKPASTTSSSQRQTYGGNLVKPTLSPSTLSTSAMGMSVANTPIGPRLNNFKVTPITGQTLVSSMSTSGGVTKTYMNTTKVPQFNSNNFPTATGSIRSAPIIRLPVGDKTVSLRPLNPNITTNHLGISLLQPRMSITNSQGLGNLMFSAPIMTSTMSSPQLVSRLTNMSDSTSVSGLRPQLESGKVVSVTNTVTPVPMRLVPNQAARQTTGSGIVITTTTTTTPTVTSGTSPVKSVLVGQPKLASVKLIDLTADEEAAAAVASGSGGGGATSILTPLTAGGLTTVTTGAGVGLITNKALNTAGLTNTVSVLSSTLPSPGQIITINPVGTTIAANLNTLRVNAPIIRTSTVTTGVSGGTSAIVSTTPMRYAYLVNTTSVMTMVRPNQQPLFVTQNHGQRLEQPGTLLRPNVPTIMLQRGTTLVPIQGQVNNIRPGTINVRSLVTTNTITTSSAAAATAVAGTTVRNVVPALVVPAPPVVVQQQQQQSAAAATAVTVPSSPVLAPKTMPSSLPPSTTSSSSSMASSIAQSQKSALGRPTANNLLTSKNGHPALLPPQPLYCTKDLVSRRCLPPKPSLKISKVANGIVLSWNMSLNNTFAEIANYQLYAYQEGTSAPSSTLWKKVGDVRALPLPMACTLTQFVEGHKYYFAVRAVDVHGRIGPFSDAGSIALITVVSNNGVSKLTPPSKS